MGLLFTTKGDPHGISHFRTTRPLEPRQDLWPTANVALAANVYVLTLPIRNALDRKRSNRRVKSTKLVVVDFYAHRGPVNSVTASIRWRE